MARRWTGAHGGTSPSFTRAGCACWKPAAIKWKAVDAFRSPREHAAHTAAGAIDEVIQARGAEVAAAQFERVSALAAP